MNDSGAFIGPWPFRRLADTDPDSLEARLRREGIVEALVSPLEALFHGDPQPANVALAAALATRPFFRFAPILNPTLPGVDRALARCREAGPVAAIRLLPNYHGYAPDDEAVIALARAASLPILVQIRMQDVRAMHPLAQVPDVDCAAILTLARRAPDVSIVAAGPNGSEAQRLGEAAADLPNLYQTLSHAEWRVDVIRQFVDRFGSDRLLFATHAPLFTPTAARSKLEAAHLDEAAHRAIASENYRRLIPV